MKSTRTLAFIGLLFLLPVASFAAKNSKQVTFDSVTKIGTTDVQPGTYKVEWNGAGPEVKVDFLQNKKLVASTSAKLVNGAGEFDSAIQTRRVNADSVVLDELDYKNFQLVFPDSGAQQPSGN